MEKGTEDTSTLVQVEEVKCAIRKLSFVTVLSPVRAVKVKGRGYGSCLTCYCCREHDSCGKKQEQPVHVYRQHDEARAGQKSSKNRKRVCAGVGEGKGYC